MINFAIEPSRMALLVTDMQNVFVERSPVSAPEGLQLLNRLNHLADVCHEVGIQVVYTAHVVRPDHSNMGIPGDIIPPVQAGLIDDGSISGALHAGVRMKEGDILLKKPRYGAFHGTDLELILRDKGIDTLIIGGIATNVCCETTAREAQYVTSRSYFSVMARQPLISRIWDSELLPPKKYNGSPVL